MSNIPQSFRDANDVIRAGAASEGYKAVISTRATRSAHGYHAGKSEIYGPNGSGDKDYSVRRPRDKAGLSDASSAQDISFVADPTIPGSGKKANDEQVRFTQWLVEQAKAGLADLMEVIGPGADGRAYYHSKPKWKVIGPRPRGDSHEYHTHVGHPRDTEFSDRAAIFRPFYPNLTDPVPPSPVEPEPPLPPLENPLQDELDAANAHIDELTDQLAAADGRLDAKDAKAHELLAL